MTTVAYCAVAPEGRTQYDQIWMRPQAVPGLRRLTEAVHAEGAAIDLAMEESFELVAMARALLREPDFVNRVREESAARSLCVHCNKCMPTNFSGTRCVLT